MMTHTLMSDIAYTIIFTYLFIKNVFRGRRGRDYMVFGFTTACAIKAYHH